MSTETETRLRVYVAGPMTGYEDLNRPAHAGESERLAALGHDPVSPAGWIDQTQDRARCLQQAFALLVGCDAISVLPGWEASSGTRAEVAMARAIGLQVWAPEAPMSTETPETASRAVIKADLVRDRLAEIEKRFGPAAADQATKDGLPVKWLTEEYHGPITSVESANQRGGYLAECGNYPSGMDPCTVAGLNGDSADGCLFAGEPICTCEDTHA